MMSRSVLALLVVRDRLRTRSMSHNGTPLSDRDRCTWTEALFMCGCHLIDLSTRFSREIDVSSIARWMANVASLDLTEVASVVSGLVTGLRMVHEPCSYSSFKGSIPATRHAIGVFVAPIKEELTSFLSAPTAESFAVPYQFVSFLEHVSLQDIEYDVWSEYRSKENELRTYTYPPVLVSELSDIITEWTAEWALLSDEFAPQHGPGSTFEVSRKETHLKAQYLAFDQMGKYVFSKHGSIDLNEWTPPQVNINAHQETRLVSVAKSIKSRRVISAEPAAKQFLQQAVAKSMDSYFQSTDLRRHIDLHSQSESANMALAGSGAGQLYATVDLSAASDSITLALVKLLFRRSPLLPYLLGTRSYMVRIPGEEGICRLAKFAPMGSATCFPVQTLIFAAIVELASRRARRYGITSCEYPYRVYGDDIVVAQPLYEEVRLALSSLNFKVNEAKSYGIPYRFREACGMHAYDGTDVTPLRVPRNFSEDAGGSVSPDHYGRIMDLANECYSRDFRVLRSYLIQRLLGARAHPPFFSREGLGTIRTSNPTNHRAIWRWNDDWQQWMVRCTVLDVKNSVRCVSSRPLALDEYQGPDESNFLWEWLRQAESIKTLRDSRGPLYLPEDALVVGRSPVVPCLSYRWLPADGYGAQPLPNSGQDGTPTVEEGHPSLR